jgi:hypothetical protein
MQPVSRHEVIIFVIGLYSLCFLPFATRLSTQFFILKLVNSLQISIVAGPGWEDKKMADPHAFGHLSREEILDLYLQQQIVPPSIEPTRGAITQSFHGGGNRSHVASSPHANVHQYGGDARPPVNAYRVPQNFGDPGIHRSSQQFYVPYDAPVPRPHSLETSNDVHEGMFSVAILFYCGGPNLTFCLIAAGIGRVPKHSRTF